MPTPRKRKVKRNLIGERILSSASLNTAVAADDTNLLDAALNGPDTGGAAAFTAGSTTLLTDAVSDKDGNWSAGAVTYTLGETSDLGDDGSVKHYFMPKVGTAANTEITSQSQPAIVYSQEGPQASLNHLYFDTRSASGSLTFNENITGSGPHSHIKLYFAGTMHSESTADTFDKLELYTGSNPPVLSASVSGTNGFLSGSVYVAKGNLSAGLKLSFSASSDATSQWNSGFFVYLTGAVPTLDTGSAWEVA